MLCLALSFKSYEVCLAWSSLTSPLIALSLYCILVSGFLLPMLEAVFPPAMLLHGCDWPFGDREAGDVTLFSSS